MFIKIGYLSNLSQLRTSDACNSTDVTRQVDKIRVVLIQEKKITLIHHPPSPSKYYTISLHPKDYISLIHLFQPAAERNNKKNNIVIIVHRVR